MEEEKEKRTIDEDANVYKVLAMLLEPTMAKEYEKMKKEEMVIVHSNVRHANPTKKFFRKRIS